MNGWYAFFIRLDFMFSMSLWKEFQLLQILNDLSIRHLIKLGLYENEVKLLQFKRSPYRSICDMFEVWDFDYWYLKWLHQEKQPIKTSNKNSRIVCTWLQYKKTVYKEKNKVKSRSIIPELQNRVTHYDATNRVTNSKMFFSLIFRQ